MVIMKYILKNLNSNLLLTTSDSELTEFCKEVFSLGEKYPEIYKKIKHDQDVHGKKKKLLRNLDKQYLHSKIPDLPEIGYEQSDLSDQELVLAAGRPRMRPELVLLFLLLRGYYGSVTDRAVCDRFKDSMTLYVLFGNLNSKIPASTTILENINSLSNETRDFIFNCQLEDIFSAELDDFSYVMFDSTTVSASACWPTDAAIIFRLLERVYVYGEKFEHFGVQPIRAFYFTDWLKEMKQLLFKINNTKGTKKRKKQEKVKPLYEDYLKTAHKAYGYLVRIFELRSAIIKSMDMSPSEKQQLLKIHDRMEEDLLMLSPVLYYTEERVFNEIVLPSTEKIISLSDETAAFIKKGQRNPAIGYKPQLAQSKNGFITALLIEAGNSSDSGNLFPLTKLHAANTGVIPKFISTDDGYSSASGRTLCLDFGVEDVCLSGAVGKKITPPELWESEEYILGRKKRSAIESLMFTLKYVFEFGQLRRRGIDNVKAEMTEEIIAYNIRRKILLQEQLQREADEAERRSA